MKILILGGASFIGINIAQKLVADPNNQLTLVDSSADYFPAIYSQYSNIKIEELVYKVNADFISILKDQDVVYHLASTTVPTTSNRVIPEELETNIITSAQLLDACVKCGVKKVVFISSGGAVYGKESICPIKEESVTNPITTYGVQKITIEKLLYLYNCMYGLDYSITRLANPFGPYQRPNGIQGAVTTFIYKALTNDEITVFGDGSVIRDYIYIEDAVNAILNIALHKSTYKIYNIGSGSGMTLNSVLTEIGKALGKNLTIRHVEGRKVDVSVNFLDISRYEKEFGALCNIGFREGILKTAEFMCRQYNI